MLKMKYMQALVHVLEKKLTRSITNFLKNLLINQKIIVNILPEKMNTKNCSI